MQRFGLAPDVEGVDRDSPFAELLVRARVLGEHQNAVAGVDERPLFRNEVHPVVDGVHEQHVVLLVRGHRLRERVGDLNFDRARMPRTHRLRLELDRLAVGDVFGDRLA